MTVRIDPVKVTPPVSLAASISAAQMRTDFLSRVLPWPDGNDAPGYGNIHWTFAPDDGGAPRWTGKPFRSAIAAAGFVEWLLTKPSTRDIYFCLSQQKACKQNKHGKFVADRSQQNAIALKALWLDIDVKEPPKGYATIEEACVALKAFYTAIRLPLPSAVIKSGGGLHAYWINKTPLTPDKWRPLAEQLKNAALHHGLRCDAGCTTDAARILRVPGTWNYKRDPRRRVQTLLLGENYDFE